MKKLIIGVLAIIVAVVGAVVSAPQAHAKEGTFTSDKYCVDYSRVKTCWQVNWSAQADKTGVRLNRFKMTTDNCRFFEKEGEKYSGTTVGWTSGRSSQRTKDKIFPYYPVGCSLYDDVTTTPGAPTGSMDVTFEGKARLNNDDDRRIYISIRVYSSGSSKLIEGSDVSARPVS